MSFIGTTASGSFLTHLLAGVLLIEELLIVVEWSSFSNPGFSLFSASLPVEDLFKERGIVEVVELAPMFSEETKRDGDKTDGVA